MSYNNNHSNLKNTKKIFDRKIILIGIAVLVIVAIVGIFFTFSGKSNKKVSILFNQDKPILIKKDGKYGYIDTNGKVIIEPKYDEAYNFKGNYAVVEKDYDSLIIDKSGKVIIKSKIYNTIKYYEEFDVWLIDNKLYNGSLKQLSDEGIKVDYEVYEYFSWIDNNKKQGGIMNFSGKKTYTTSLLDGEDYISIDLSSNASNLKGNYCKFTIAGKRSAIVNCDTGKVIFDYTDKGISSKGNNIFEIYDKDSYDILYSIYIQDDKILYQTENSDIELKSYDIDDGYITIYDDENYKYVGYIDIKTGKIVKDMTSSDSSSSLNDWEIKSGFDIFKCNSKYGVKSKDKIIIDCEWDDIDYFNVQLYEFLSSQGKPYVLAEKGSKTYLLNVKTGKTVAEFNSMYIYPSSSSVFLYYTDEDTNKKVIYSLVTGKSLVLDEYDDYDLYTNYITVEVGDKINYYNNNLKLIYTSEE